MTAVAPGPEATPSSGPDVFGDAWPSALAFADMLVREGELRGLIGPRELPRLWTRHLLNSAAVTGFVPDGVTLADVGSGAGFPGVVVALMRPDVEIHLIEPMERRVVWLGDVVREIGLQNVTVHRARAEEVNDTYDVVTARAVAALRKLVPWVAPLLRSGGRLLAMKGERAGLEVEDAQNALRKARLERVQIHEVVVPGTAEPTRIVEAHRV